MASSSALRKSPALSPAGYLGILSVSASISPERFRTGCEYLRSLGYKLKIPIDPSQNYGSQKHLFSSAAASERVAALHQLFCDPEVGAVLAVRGAYGAMELLDLIDYELVSAHPKLFIGLSDVTALLLALYQKSRIITIHGPTLQSTFSKASTNVQAQKSGEILLSYLHGEQRNPFKTTELKVEKPGDTPAARLSGGNLSVLTALLGTPYEPRFDQHILFLEDVGEKPYRIHRMLLQLKLAGKFDRLKALLLGDFSRCEPSVDTRGQAVGPTLREVFDDIFAGYSFPVLSQLPVGHEDLSLPIPIGARAKISGNKLEIIEAAVL